MKPEGVSSRSILELISKRFTSDDAFRKRLGDLARKLGFEFWAFVERGFPGYPRMRAAMVSNYPSDWERRYTDEQLAYTDPMIENAILNIGRPHVWTTAPGDGSPAVLKEGLRHGIRCGWALSYCASPGLMSVFVLARENPCVGDAELVGKEPLLTHLAWACHHQLHSDLAPQAGSVPRLTKREVEILRWTALGKTSGEIATIIEHTTRAVEFHMQNAMRKLDVVNKTQAVASAIMLGLLHWPGIRCE